MGVEDQSARAQTTAPTLVEVEDDEADAVPGAVSGPIPTGSIVCQHNMGTCLQSMCQHDCCQKRAATLGAKRGTTLDLQLVQQMQSARSKAKAPIPSPKKIPFAPPVPIAKPPSSQTQPQSQTEQQQQRSAGGGDYPMEVAEEKQPGPGALQMLDDVTMRWYDTKEEKDEDVAILHVRQPVTALRPFAPPTPVSQRPSPAQQPTRFGAAFNSASPARGVDSAGSAAQVLFPSAPSSAPPRRPAAPPSSVTAAQQRRPFQPVAAASPTSTRPNLFARFQLGEDASASTGGRAREGNRNAFRGIDAKRIAGSGRLFVGAIEDPNADSGGWERSRQRTSHPSTTPYQRAADPPHPRHDRSLSPQSRGSAPWRGGRGDVCSEEEWGRGAAREEKRSGGDWDEDRTLRWDAAETPQRRGGGYARGGEEEVDGARRWEESDSRCSAHPASSQRVGRSLDDEDRGWRAGGGGAGVKRWQKERWQEEDYDNTGRHQRGQLQQRTSPYFRHSSASGGSGVAQHWQDENEDQPLPAPRYVAFSTEELPQPPSSSSYAHCLPPHPPLPRLSRTQPHDTPVTSPSDEQWTAPHPPEQWQRGLHQRQQQQPADSQSRYSLPPAARSFTSPTLYPPPAYTDRRQWSGLTGHSGRNQLHCLQPQQRGCSQRRRWAEASEGDRVLDSAAD